MRIKAALCIVAFYLALTVEVYYKVDRLLTDPTAQLKGTTVRWYSNKTSLCVNYMNYLIPRTFCV